MKGQSAKLCILDEWGCNLDEQRFYDSETKQWGFDIVCLNETHKDIRCPSEREILRLDPISDQRRRGCRHPDHLGMESCLHLHTHG